MYIYLEHKIISAQYDTISVSLKSRAEQTATKQATHLKLSDDVHRIGPCHSPPPCRHETINTTLLSLTLKSTREGVSEKSGRGEQESVSARIHPRNAILSAHIHSHNPRAAHPLKHAPPTRPHEELRCAQRGVQPAPSNMSSVGNQCLYHKH